MSEFKLNQFKVNDSRTVYIRFCLLPNKKQIVFGIAGTDLTVIEEDVDFDLLSDKLIEENKKTEEHLVFEYVPDFGFLKVSTDEVNWYHF